MAKGKKKSVNKADKKQESKKPNKQVEGDSKHMGMVMIDRRRVEAAGYFNAMMGGLNDAKGIIDGIINDVTSSKAIRIEISMVDIEYSEEQETDEDVKGEEDDNNKGDDPEDTKGAATKSGEEDNDEHDENATDLESLEDVTDPFKGVEGGSDTDEKIDPDEKK